MLICYYRAFQNIVKSDYWITLYLDRILHFKSAKNNVAPLFAQNK